MRVLAILLLCASLAAAQELQSLRITSSPNPIGSGARATAMGGAFIAIADDSTASSWNPAGLIQLERPEFSLVGEGFFRLEDFTSSAHPESDSSHCLDLYRLNYINVAVPFIVLRHNVVASLNYQRLYGFERQFDFDYNLGGDVLTQKGRYRFEQEGDLYALSPALGLRLSRRLSVGATFNLWRDPPWRDYTWRSTLNYDGVGAVVGEPFNATIRVEDEYRNFRAENFNLGVLYELTPRIALGAVWKTPFTADLVHDHRVRSLLDFGDGGGPELLHTTSDEELHFPWILGAGVRVQWNPQLKTALDVTYTPWEDFVRTDGNGHRFSAVTGRRASGEHIDPTWTVRLGGEYLVFADRAIIPLRAGLFYDPEPSHRHPDDYAGFSLGSGYVNEGFSLDFSYTYRFGRNVGGDVVDISGARMDVDQHRVLVSLIKYF